jgi:hypothetical protein
VEESEVEDLYTDFKDMPTSCAKKSTTPKKATPKTAYVDNLSTQMSSMKVTKVKYVSFTWRFPMAMYSVNEETTKKIFIKIMKGVQLPEEYILHAKVLPGGKQFSLLCGVPRYMYEEVYMQRNHHNTNSAIFQAFDRFVIQPVLALFHKNSSFFERSPQIIQLDEECIESPVPVLSFCCSVFDCQDFSKNLSCIGIAKFRKRRRRKKKVGTPIRLMAKLIGLR